MKATIEVELEGLHFTCTTTDKDEVKKMMDIILSAESVTEIVKPVETKTYKPTKTVTRQKHKNISIPKRYACGRIRTHLVDKRIIEDILKDKTGKHITSKQIKAVVKKYYPKKSKAGIRCDNNAVQIYLLKSGWATRTAGKHGITIKQANYDSAFDEIPWVECK